MRSNFRLSSAVAAWPACTMYVPLQFPLDQASNTQRRWAFRVAMRPACPWFGTTCSWEACVKLGGSAPRFFAKPVRTRGMSIQGSCIAMLQQWHQICCFLPIMHTLLLRGMQDAQGPAGWLHSGPLLTYIATGYLQVRYCLLCPQCQSHTHTSCAQHESGGHRRRVSHLINS